ncbi:hypothetical protein GEMRC1_002606 [Eukaryota sp. GEM-RC1]
MIVDVSTRWNSSFMMLERYSQLIDIVDHMIFNDNKLMHLKLTISEREDLHQLLIFLLSDFYELTEICSSRSTVTVSVGLTLFNLLWEKLKVICDPVEGRESGFISAVASKVLEKFTQYISGRRSDRSVFDFAGYVGLVLDPRFKNNQNFLPSCYIENEEMLKGSMREFIESKVGSLAVSTEESQNNPQGKSLMKELVRIKLDELDIYLSDGLIEMDQDPLMWWKLNESKFPTLARTSRIALSVQASNVASESFFSQAGRVVAPDRSRLTDLNVEACVCLKRWTVE